MRIISFLTVFTLCAAAVTAAWAQNEKNFYVAGNGNDAWSGTLAAPSADGTDGPFATLGKAREAVREAKKSESAEKSAFTVTVCGGEYELDAPFTLENQDGGSENARVVWKAAKGEEVRLSAGKRLSVWNTVTDPEILKRLPEAVRGKVISVNLKAAGLENYGSPKGGATELFFNGEPMNVSRYPNEGFLKIVSVDVNEPKDVRGTKGDQVGNFQFDDEHLLTWDDEKDVWVHGYWFWDWSEERHPVAEIVKETKTLKVQPPYHSYGYRKGQWFYAFNLLCEIDVPGEYYIDRENGILYFYPPADVTADSMVVTVQDQVMKISADYVTVEGFTCEFSRNNGVSCTGKCDVLKDLTVRNTSGGGISMGGTGQLIDGCELYNLGKNGIGMSGGDRKTLSPSGNVVTNCIVHDYGRIQRVYAPGISVSGVGNTVSHCRIYNAPHMGMGFSGNDNVIEFNEIYNVCFESNDAGAIYTGRNWTMRGNVLRYNYLHDIQGFQNRGCVGIYLDDQFSSAEMFGNIFVNVTRATMIGGGRDSKIVNNIFINCNPCVHLDARGLGWQKDFTEKWVQELREKGTNNGINILEPPYSTKYPELTTILTNNPGTPVGNVVAKNICIGGNFGANTSGQWKGTSIWQKAPEFNTIEGNFLDGDSMIEDWEHGNFTLKADSPALKDGFQQIPWQKIGPVREK